MDVSDIMLKLQEHCHYPADWNNKVVDGVLRVFKYLLKAGKNTALMGDFTCSLEGRINFTLRLNLGTKRL